MMDAARSNVEFFERLTGSGENGQKPKFRSGYSLAWFANAPIEPAKTLLGKRYLCRGGGMFIVAPSCLGKSTLSIQMAILWACGLIAFGIKPAKALRILIVQSEDDQGDCTEMALVMNHLGLSQSERAAVEQNTKLIHCNDLVGARFIEALKTELQEAKDAEDPFDLVIINPYGVYLGADVKDTKACTEFLNQWLNPVLTEFDIAAILIHHTAKTNFQNTDKYKIWDWMYHGAGCACITNWARAILAIKPETEDLKVYRFIAAKRGARIGQEWEDKFEHFFAWSSIPGVLRWEEATAEQIAAATVPKNATKVVDLDKALSAIPLTEPDLLVNVVAAIQGACSCGVAKAKDAMNQLIFKGRVRKIPIENPGKGRDFVGVVRT